MAPALKPSPLADMAAISASRRERRGALCGRRQSEQRVAGVAIAEAEICGRVFAGEVQIEALARVRQGKRAEQVRGVLDPALGDAAAESEVSYVDGVGGAEVLDQIAERRGPIQ